MVKVHKSHQNQNEKLVYVLVLETPSLSWDLHCSSLHTFASLQEYIG